MNKTDLREYSNNLRKKAQKLIDSYDKYGKSISALHSSKIALQSSFTSQSSLSSTAHMLIQKEEFKKNKLKMIQYEEKINEYKLKLETIYRDFFESFILIKEYEQNLNDISRVERNNLRLSLIHLNKQVKKINKMILIELDAELNTFLESKKKLKKIISNVLITSSIVLHSLYTDLHFKYRVNDYSKLKKLKRSDLETGDIILNDDYNLYKKSIAMRQIKYFTKSTILHVAIFYDHQNNRDIIYEASGRNRKVSYLGDLKIEEGSRHIIMRLPKKFNSQEKEIIKNIIEDNVNQEFSIIKLYGIALNYVLLKLYKTWFPFITTGKNIYFGKGIFCSQTIGEIYKNFGYNISNKEDLGMLSPLDIFNSFELDIVGYIEKE